MPRIVRRGPSGTSMLVLVSAALMVLVAAGAALAQGGNG